MTLKRRSKIDSSFNMSSMTDIIFLLLIFFVITSTTVREPIMKIALPKGVKKNIVKQIVRVYVDKELNYAIDEKKIPLARLPYELKEILNQKPNATVSIHGDQEIHYGAVMELVRLADQMEAKVVLALDPSD